VTAQPFVVAIVIRVVVVIVVVVVAVAVAIALGCAQEFLAEQTAQSKTNK